MGIDRNSANLLLEGRLTKSGTRKKKNCSRQAHHRSIASTATRKRPATCSAISTSPAAYRIDRGSSP